MRLLLECVKARHQRIDFCQLLFQGTNLALQRRDLCIFLLELGGQPLSLPITPLVRASLLLNFVEKHRRQHVIGDRLGLAVFTTNHQLRINLRDFFSDQSILFSVGSSAL